MQSNSALTRVSLLSRIKTFAEQSGKMTQIADTLEEALEIAAQAASREDLICVTGSFYLVGEAKKYIKKLEANRN